MSEPSKTFRPALPKGVAPLPGSSGAAPAPAKKKMSMTSFMPVIPGSNPKAAPSAGGASSAPPKMPFKPTNRSFGAPPGHSRPKGHGVGGRPTGGFKAPYVPRAPAWVPVGATPVVGMGSDAMDGVEGMEGKGEASVRKEKQYAKADIAPTAQSMAIDPLNLNHPMTLPFLDPLKANPDLKKNGDSAPSSSSRGNAYDGSSSNDFLRSSSSQIASATSVRAMGTEAERSNPANLMFQNDEGRYEGEDQLFFIQMPSALPFGDIPVRPPSSVETQNVLGFQGNLAALPSGTIGKLVIFRSGKVKLRIGDQFFDVATGMPCNFLQEVVAINTAQKKFYQLGDISRRMVCYPDIEHLLDSESASPSNPHSMDLS